MGNIAMTRLVVMSPENRPISADKPGPSLRDNEPKYVVNDKVTGKPMLCDLDGWCEALPPVKNSDKPLGGPNISVIKPSVDYGI